MDVTRRSVFVGLATACASVPGPSFALVGPGAGHSPWWQSAVGYQIYPASFCDSNGDGIGDIAGIISKLDYLADLGIGFIWLSPVYQSPMVDNGYDISDYQAINPMFGTMADMERLIVEARARGIGIVMDLVVNHTSDKHPWFLAARADKASPYRDYYIWRDTAPEKGAPEDLTASFGGSAWTWDEAAKQYYCHLFAPQQPDLNWANPALRAAIYRMMNWWLDKGIAGFRMDVIELIGKDIAAGITANGPKLHDYVQEMHRVTLAGRDVVTVGETWNSTPAVALQYCAPARRELSMIFQFDHVRAFWDEKLGKWKPKPIELPILKAAFAKWQSGLNGKGWNSLFWGNHDLPRAVSRYGDDGAQRVESARMLATVLHLMQGTPYVYQGEEIGMTNAGFTSIDQYRDLETINFHKIQLENGVSEQDFLAGARANSRDNSRTPMQWTSGRNAGFSDGKPWIDVNPNYQAINVDEDSKNPSGVRARYKQLIELRKNLPIIRHGDFRLLAPDHAQIFAYERRLGKQRLIVIANFSGSGADYSQEFGILGRDLFTQKPRSLPRSIRLRPYEVITLLA